jgi:hypothetical protein
MPTIDKIKYQENITTLLLTKLAPRAPGLRENFELAAKKNSTDPSMLFRQNRGCPTPHTFLSIPNLIHANNKIDTVINRLIPNIKNV